MGTQLNMRPLAVHFLLSLLLITGKPDTFLIITFHVNKKKTRLINNNYLY